MEWGAAPVAGRAGLLGRLARAGGNHQPHQSVALREAYNRPGIIDQTNWSLRVAADFERAYREAHNGKGILAQALAWALHARSLDQDAEGQALAAALLKEP